MEEQLDYPRVKTAVDEKWPNVRALLESNDISSDSFDLLIRAFKFEENVEVWAKDRDSSTFKNIKTYKFCSNVGALGPKRKQGDLQIPEGYYHLSKFNPESNYHLSLKVSYPNLSDSLLGYQRSLGGMIFIHGGCATIGCIPINDENISELYVAALKAHASGQDSIPIHIYPVHLTDENMSYLSQVPLPKRTFDFWKNLKQGYDHFNRQPTLNEIKIDSTSGRYFFTD